ncbi:Thiol-specific monooxygenase [Pseudocercospora fuligena]|uniref:Thiol-specific monooxygenase n=1 Tax=Pseudocercospora fuligena TaxID=685502 RepID=A0A8H6VIA7_9PEZI|nr:Thiol-specific monooxygenase [Pseudocercospora fuligena]
MGSLPPRQRFRANNVAIIGAGPSGIAAAKYLLAEKAFSRITIFEQRSTTGGLWNYIPCDSESALDVSIPQTSPHAGLDQPIWKNSNEANDGQEQAQFMTAVYERLETNIPRGLMGFSDLEWPEDCQLFPKHEDVLEYIEQYAKDVLHLIQFRTQVLDVRPHSQDQWLVKTQAVEQKIASTPVEEVYDAVIVASGHYAVPYIPDVVGIQDWNRAHPGLISHSKYYRKPENYTGKKVIVVGNSASGIDIGAQIATVCKLPLLMSQKSESYLNVGGASPEKQEKPEIIEYLPESRGVKFADGTTETDIDAVVYCTGYFYSYPFLESLDPPVVSTGRRVENIYHHLFYRQRPTLSFLVLNQKVIPFPFAEVQSALVARVLSGRLTLPSEEDMRAWEEDNVKEAGEGTSFHVLKFPKDADYLNMLHDWAVSVDETKEGVNGAVGKTPPYWSEKQYWIRERFPNIKKAFNDLGEARHKTRRLEDVGYDFEAWRREKEKEEHIL